MRINILMVKIRALETLPTEKVTSAPEPSAGARENAKHFLERHIQGEEQENVTFEGEGKSEAFASRQELSGAKYLNSENSRLGDSAD